MGDKLIRHLAIATVLVTTLSGCVGAVIGGTAASLSLAHHDRRTAGTIVEDQAIELKAYQVLGRDAALDSGSHINVTSYNNAVLLTGEVVSEQLAQRAEDLIAGIDKVKRVHNELGIGPASSFASRSADGLVTAKVKANLFRIDGLPDFDATRVKVITERGNVYLFGLLRPQEAEAVTSTVRRVGGVQKVIKLFEYLEQTG